MNSLNNDSVDLLAWPGPLVCDQAVQCNAAASFGIGASIIGGEKGGGFAEDLPAMLLCELLGAKHWTAAASKPGTLADSARLHLRLRTCRFHGSSSKNESCLPVHEGWLKGRLALCRYLQPQARAYGRLDLSTVT